MNQLDKQYQELLFDIIQNGIEKDTRNGKTKSLFGRQIRHKMSEGFPILTTKRMYWKGIVTELIWFLRGDTNIKYLVDNDCHIWDGDAYKNYLHKVIRDKDIFCYLKSYSVDTNGVPTIEPYSKDEFIERIKTDFEFSNKWGDLGPVYGSQWRSWCGFEKIPSGWNHGAVSQYKEIRKCDQFQNLINEIKTNPDSRRLMVNAWNVGELDKMTLPPCHYGFQVYTRELSQGEREDLYWKKYGYDSVNMEGNDLSNIPTRAISLMWNQRSVDTFLGLPFNITSYGLLLEVIGKMVNMIPDELIGNLGDVHLYENHLSQASEQITREPYNLPKIEINDQYWVNDCDLDTHILSMLIEDFKIQDYQSHPTIKAPLSN